MMTNMQAAFVVGRRDFTATVYSRTFFFFLLGPLVILAFSVGMGTLSARMAERDSRSTVAVVANAGDYRKILAAHERLKSAFGTEDLVDIVQAEPDYVVSDQVGQLLQAPDKKVLAVLTGGVDHPRLTGAVSDDDSVRRQVSTIIRDAREHRVLSGHHLAVPPVDVPLVKVAQSAGSLAAERSLTSRLGQTLLFMLTVFLASMLLSNLAEEKSNKVIEVLAAAIPVDAIFAGKLGSMLLVSLLGIAVWTTAGIVGVELFLPVAHAPPPPAVGWPIFLALVFLYFAANYLLLGALFLGIGSQANSIREVQTMAMPVTMGQLLIFFFAQVAAGSINSLLGIAGAIFPFSSPLTMIARAAQTPELWPHAAALVWQALWVWLTVQLGASLFRSNVMKSGSGGARMKKAKA
ncbi:MAG: transporter permease [Alphaproteobacteria bacterium]|nr:transporter permease [Alphaproteobacteria bacterium]